MAGFLLSPEITADGFVEIIVPESVDNGDATDVALVTFNVPMSLLKKSSEVFARMFDGDWKEAREKRLHVTEFKASAFKQFLDVLAISFASLPNAIERQYNSITCETICAVLPIAEYYQVVRVRTTVIAAVQHSVKEESVRGLAMSSNNNPQTTWFWRLLSRLANSPAAELGSAAAETTQVSSQALDLVMAVEKSLIGHQGPNWDRSVLEILAETRFTTSRKSTKLLTPRHGYKGPKASTGVQVVGNGATVSRHSWLIDCQIIATELKLQKMTTLQFQTVQNKMQMIDCAIKATELKAQRLTTLI